VEWYCACCCVLQWYGHKERLLCEEEEVDRRTCLYSTGGTVVHRRTWLYSTGGTVVHRHMWLYSTGLEASQQQSAVKYILDCPCPLLLTHYLPFFGVDNQNYTVFCFIYIVFVWIVYVYCLCVEWCCQNECSLSLFFSSKLKHQFCINKKLT
jgi:hypothetical protein